MVKEGDIVRLKSGGPPMTVVAVNDGQVRCFWFVGSDPTRHEDEFPEATLEVENGNDEPMDAGGLTD